MEFIVAAAPPYFFGAVSAEKFGEHPMPVKTGTMVLKIAFKALSMPKKISSNSPKSARRKL
jgi:hypothetical protein